jgi:type II secretory pathway component PulF
MSIYKYRARSRENKIINGAVEAINEAEAAELLREKGMYVLSLDQSREGNKKSWNVNLGKVKHKDVVVFSRQLAVMISATVPIVQALRILAKQTANTLFIEKIIDMANDVEGGMKLSSAMSRSKKTFSNFYVSMVKSGETSGRLDEVLEYLADQMEKDYDLISRIKGAMIYPIFVLSGMVVVGFIMMAFVIPKMTTLLTESGAELPFLTRILIAVSDFIADNYIFIFIAAIIAFLILRVWTRSKAGKIAWDTIKVQVPLFGPLFKKIYIVRFTRSLSTLIKGGVPIAAALRITAEVVDNQAYQELIMQTVLEVEGGNSLATVFVKSDLMPTMLPQMMIIGERTGKLDLVLEKLSGFYSREIDNMVNALTSLIEPLILVIMGVGVGVMVAAIMLPIFQLAQSMG